jgi:hypothetical protein
MPTRAAQGGSCCHIRPHIKTFLHPGSKVAQSSLVSHFLSGADYMTSVRPGGIKQNKPRCYKLEAAWCLLVGTAGCQQEPQMDACASSGYDQGVCADEQSRRAAAAAFLGGYMQQRPASFQPAPYQAPVYQLPQIPVPRTTQCNSTPNYTGGFSTTCQ